MYKSFVHKLYVQVVVHVCTSCHLCTSCMYKLLFMHKLYVQVVVHVQAVCTSCCSCTSCMYKLLFIYIYIYIYTSCCSCISCKCTFLFVHTLYTPIVVLVLAIHAKVVLFKLYVLVVKQHLLRHNLVLDKSCSAQC